MISLLEAYQLVKHHGRDEGKVLFECKDFGTFYGFSFVRPEVVGQLFGGCFYYSVDKRTKTIGLYSPQDDLDVYSKCKPIDISIFNDDKAPD